MYHHRSVASRALGAALAATGALLLTLAPGSAFAVTETPEIVLLAPGDGSDQGAGARLEGILADAGELTLFDGGDGTAPAWDAALTSADVLVLPATAFRPLYVPGGTNVMDDEAVMEVAGWVRAGGRVLVPGAGFAPDLFDALTGRSHGDVWSMVGTSPSWTRASDDESLPTEVPYEGESIDQYRYPEWPDVLKASVSARYVSADDGGMGVGDFTAGAGLVTYYAWNFKAEASEAGAAAWTQLILADVRNVAIGGGPVDPTVPAEPSAPVVPPAVAASRQLAETGVDGLVGLVVPAGVALIGAALMVTGARRRGDSSSSEDGRAFHGSRSEPDAVRRELTGAGAGLPWRGR